MMVRVWQAWRPPLGRPVFVLLLAAGACLPLAIHAGRWAPGSGVLVALGLAGSVVGNWLAGWRPAVVLRRGAERGPSTITEGNSRQDSAWRLSDRQVWAFGFTLGAMAAFVAVGQTLPSVMLLLQAYGSVEVVARGSGLGYEFIRIAEVLARVLWIYWREAALRGLAFAAQILNWVRVAVAGGVSRDNDIFLLWTGWLSWSMAFHAMATFTRKRHPALALAPLGLAVTAASAADPQRDGWLYAFIGLGTILWCLGVYFQLERRWARQRTDYSPEIGTDIAMIASVLAIFVVGAAFTVARGIPWAGTILRRPLAGPTQRVSNTLDRLFGGVRRPPIAAAVWHQADFADLPLSRVLAGPPELRDTPMLRVTVSQPDKGDLPHVYWRGLTYDQYTSRGWANSVSETVPRPPQLSQLAHLGPEITQGIKLLTDDDPVRYAAARPLRVDVGATWVTRGGSDLIGWYADAREYTVVSRPTMASVEELRGAAEDYPAWVTERYLQLPVDLPVRVRRLAHELVGDAATAYDKAMAIETAMRAIDYSLEVGPPPEDRDIVDYFLFDMDAGYCDYFATAMTVLARAVGVPARVATGYATGTYDPELGFFIVTGLDAHAWVEIYFPDIGWVPFEPTPARAVFERRPAPPLVTAQREPAIGPWIGGVSLWWPVWVLLAAASAGGVGLWILRHRKAGRLTPEDRVRVVYDAVWRRAGWLGWNGEASQTPWERIEALQDALSERSVDVAVGGRRLAWRGADAVADLRQLALLFAKAQYSRQGVTPKEAHTAGQTWQRLRWWLLLLLRPPDR